MNQMNKEYNYKFEEVSSETMLQLLLKNQPNHQHPRILLDAAGFSEIRNAISADDGNGFYKCVAASVIEEADSYMPLPVIAYELRDGLRLLECCRDILARTSALGMAYQLTGENKYAERAWLEMHNAVCFEDWHPYHFLDTAEMALAIAIGYDWIYDWMIESQRKTIRDAIFQKAILPLLDDYDEKPRKRTWDWLHKLGVINNWRFVCNGGVAVATLAIADELEGEKQRLAGRVLKESLIHIEDALKLFAPTGAYNEGLAYWEYAMKYLAAHMRSYEICIGTDFHYFEAQGIHHTPYFVYALNGSVGVFNYHDCDIYSRHIPPEIMYIADRYGEYAMAHPRIDQVFSKGDGNVRDLIYYRPEFETAKEEELPGDFYFPEIEVVSMRCGYGENDTYVGMHCGRNYSRDSHDHMDLGVFVLDALGEQFFIELGKDDYTLPHYYRDVYRFRAEGHNTMILNPATWDSGQRYDAYAQIDVRQFGKNMSFAISDITDAFADYALSVKRGVRLNKRTQNVVVQDEIHLKEPSDLWWFAHTGAEVSVSEDGKNAQLYKNGKKLNVRLCGNDEASFSVMDAVPLPTSPQVDGQDKNEGIRKLVIHLPECKDAVLCVMIEVTPNIEEVIPLDEWESIQFDSARDVACVKID